MNDLKKKRALRWSFVLAWTVFTYATLYIVRPICEYLKVTTPFNLIVNIVLFGLLFGIILVTIHLGNVRKRYTFSLLLIAVVAYVSGFIALKIPEEKVHFIEYGFLAFLTLQALLVDMKRATAYLLAFVIVSLIGWGDEGIQYLLPNRYYQLQDVLLNAVSGAMGLFLTFVIKRENEILR